MGDDNMNQDVLKTSVDDFLALIKDRKKIALEEAAKMLNVPLATAQSWTDFLVEERILGVEYKFTTPYVFYIEKKEEEKGVSYVGFDTKEAFFEKARRKGIREGHIRLLWAKYLALNREKIKQTFFMKAMDKGITDEVKINHLWKKYEMYLEE